MNRRLARCVPQLHFGAGEKPRYLYTSGRANRANPAGVECLYCSETEATANAEFRYAWRGTTAEHQPKLTFFAHVRLRHIIDLSDRETVQLLVLTRADLQGNWRLRAITRLQEVGRAISRQASISALRYPSAAADKLGRKGWNLAIYPAALRSPDRVEILGESGGPLEILP